MIKTPIGSEGLKWPQEVTICILKCQEIPGEIIELSTLEKKIIPTLRIHIGFWIRQQFQDWGLKKKKCVCGNVEINQYISSNIFLSRIAVFFSP